MTDGACQWTFSIACRGVGNEVLILLGASWPPALVDINRWYIVGNNLGLINLQKWISKKKY